MIRMQEDFIAHELPDGHRFLVGRIPDELLVGPEFFEQLWEMHPKDRNTLVMFGKPRKAQRWQQAYGADYHFSGQRNAALPVTEDLEPFRDWARQTVDARLNGLLLNWYDGQLGHYIGPHHDSTTNMVEGAPIVTISLGETRTFRLDHPRLRLRADFTAEDGAVFVIPYEMNRVWKHSVPHFKRFRGRRISITLRAFRA